MFLFKEGKYCLILILNCKLSVILSEGKGKCFFVDIYYDIWISSGLKFVLGNVKEVLEFIRKEVCYFIKKLRYGVLIMIELLL